MWRDNVIEGYLSIKSTVNRLPHDGAEMETDSSGWKCRHNMWWRIIFTNCKGESYTYIYFLNIELFLLIYCNECTNEQIFGSRMLRVYALCMCFWKGACVDQSNIHKYLILMNKITQSWGCASLILYILADIYILTKSFLLLLSVFQSGSMEAIIGDASHLPPKQVWALTFLLWTGCICHVAKKK